MNLIEEAAKRLRQLEAAGVTRTPHTPHDAPAVQPRLVAEPGKRPLEPRPAPARTLDLPRLQASGFITPALQHSKLMQEFRLIKRPLIKHALGRSATQAPNRNLIMVTSALPDEGKTFVAVNLAMSLAMEVDCRVLLVDADVLAPSVPKMLRIEPGKGLMDMLTGAGIPARLVDAAGRVHVIAGWPSDTSDTAGRSGLADAPGPATAAGQGPVMCRAAGRTETR